MNRSSKIFNGLLISVLLVCCLLPARAQAPSSQGGVYTQVFGTTCKTFSAVAAITAAASGTDIAILPGNATNTVYLQRVTVSGVQTTAGLVKINLVKRSTADTGGTSAAMTAVPHQTGDTAAVSLPLSFTANPDVLGTAVGSVESIYLPIGPAATATANPTWVFDFGARDKPITLSGVLQGIAVNLNATTVTGGVFTVKFEWIEAIPAN